MIVLRRWGARDPRDVETYFDDGAWHNRSVGTEGPLDNYAEKVKAEAAGRTSAIRRSTHSDTRKLCEHVVRNRNHTICYRHIYPRSRDFRRTIGL